MHIGAAELADLVARRATRERVLATPDLPRLAALAPTGTGAAAGRLEARLGFQPGSEGHPQLRLVVAGTVPLVCQRCLGLLEFPVAIDERLTLVGSDAEAALLADPFDAVLLEDGDLAVSQVIEDEVLAALPLAPRHPVATCGGSLPGTDRQADDKLSNGETHRPMAGLADLLARDGRRDPK
ncbi:MAG: DUF177 domain-containing protein [Gammaproteobacteria bacterium]|nr:DUF177 domain-containing protein [Gammaproteobacteria bacterium]